MGDNFNIPISVSELAIGSFKSRTIRAKGWKHKGDNFIIPILGSEFAIGSFKSRTIRVKVL